MPGIADDEGINLQVKVFMGNFHLYNSCIQVFFDNLLIFMKLIFILTLLFFLVACGQRIHRINNSINDTLHSIPNSGDFSLDKEDQTDNFNELLKSMLIGKWQQSNAKKQIIVIKEDSMIDIYNEKIISSNHILFAFRDSAYKYYMSNKTFNFNNSPVTDLFEIQIISQNPIDTMTNIIMYVDSNYLELGYNHGIVAFKKIN